MKEIRVEIDPEYSHKQVLSGAAGVGSYIATLIRQSVGDFECLGKPNACLTPMPPSNAQGHSFKVPLKENTPQDVLDELQLTLQEIFDQEAKKMSLK